MSGNRTVPVLMYHHVTPAGGAINVTPGHFRDQLAWLRDHGYRGLTCEEFAAHLAGAAAPERSVLITFDDGYLDNYVHAWPLLREYGFHAVIFLVTSWIGDGPARPCADERGAALPETPDHAECMRRIAAGDAAGIALRWSEIERMRVDGQVEFHSHTHTHTRWDKQEGDKNARMVDELAQSRASLARHLGEVSDHLCWPQGYFDADYVRIAQSAGFRHLYTTRAFGRNRPGSDPASIFRFAVRDTSGASVGRRIRVAAHPLLGPMFNAWKRWKRGQRYAG
ncbi:polysaccharide deacetylase family protein [Castellaniella denitrificans]|uniref:Polysaccharide deacetylase family protein n=1 Tax=Castellaniella denitrificans TaxID=56119 RepID=A0ABT4M3R1_9BURK|nr:polysaccharide deacetylase family protein [Castellaniella denitrificans]MCZ4329949.1 polysaccharide deacetylase family protein [Castellaniella denitrificans]